MFTYYEFKVSYVTLDQVVFHSKFFAEDFQSRVFVRGIVNKFINQFYLHDIV